ncbi:MAG: hypothetical protein LBJ93_03155 [Clostridiales bacterium]|nr:hypothetical protein [Clostridiales bacterium]
MNYNDVLFLIVIIIGVVLAFLYFLNKWAQKKYSAQEIAIEKNKIITSVFIINKKKLKIQETNFPKEIIKKIPFVYKIFKMPTVQAKVGNKIMNLICDSQIYKEIIPKKNIKIELAGAYITKILKNNPKIKANKSTKK